MAIVRLRGVQEDNREPPQLNFRPEGESPSPEIRPKGRIRLGVARDVGGIVDLKGMQTDDVACLEYSNGFKLWTRVDDLYKENAVHRTRGEVLDEPDVWEIDPRLRDIGNAERGVGSVVVEAIEFFGVDLKGVAAKALCQWFEAKQLQADGPGLYRCSLLKNEFKLDKVPVDDSGAAALESTDTPLLLFIHGTGSSSAGGFGGLWEEGHKNGANAREAIEKQYHDACFAFEHRTLTVSPIENALEIAKALPNGAELHLITHSRGGLVGELLCLGQRDKTDDPLHEALLDKIFDSSKDRTQGQLMGLPHRLPEDYPEQKEQLIELRDVLDQKRIKVSRFVRVACPARGTTLASGRLDRWLSILRLLSGSNDIIEFLLAVLKERTDPRTLPGLEAMMPGSALVRLLNYPELKVTSDLSVIAGDIEGNSFLSKLKIQLADWFYDSEHDLVVNTGSMYGGIARQEGRARFFFDQGRDVNHFNYFKNEGTVEKLKAGLLRDEGDPGGFTPITEARHEEPKRGSALRSVPLEMAAPLAVVLHGTMGSHLTQNKERIWLDFLALSKGKLAKLGITMKGVESDSLLDDFYGDLVNYLAASHHVEAFHYDWRQSIADSAERLADLIASRLSECEAKRQPMRFVAHSMGGLVVRAMFARHPQLWQRFQALPGSRLLMMGTPNFGSYEAVRWLTGWNPTLGKLSWLDVSHDTAGLVNIISRYPGMLELLPFDQGEDYSDPELWQRICAGGDPKWPLPQAVALQNLGKIWQTLKEAPIDPDRMIYVAGWAPETVCGFDNMASRGLFSKERPPVRFYSTRKGDGTVPWALGRLPGVPTWYVEAASHDQLLAYRPAFPAYLDLLQSGSTRRLSQDEPGGSRSDGSIEVMRDKMPDSMPTEADLSTFVFGAGRPVKRVEKRRLPKVNVSVRHGNLAYARHPVCVGHYFGDTIASAEADLDRRLEGVLSQRVSLGLYPGELNSHEVFMHHDKNAKPNGAIVIGLGRVGELSPGTLTTGIGRALVDYALKISEWPDDRFGAANTVRSAKISFLLIGTGLGGISLRDSIGAILNGVKSANDRLVDTRFDDKVLIDDIEFIEIYQDVAIGAARELEMLLPESQFNAYFDWQDHVVRSGPGGFKRVLFDSDVDWWHRLEIFYDKKYQVLRYVALTDRARAEVSLVSGQMLLADQFIAEMVSNTGNSMKPAQTLFEMLLPNRLKEFAPNQYDLVLILDELSARYPWELLDDRWNPSRKPPAVVSGLLRQLKTQQFRAKPLHTTEKKAFVVGNPVITPEPDGKTEFPDLPGAKREAEAVSGLLSKFGYEVNNILGNRSTGLDAREILTGLHGDAYRILHLAGHGVYEFDSDQYGTPAETCLACEQKLPQTKKKVSGMVIGDKTFLTPGDVEQMRWVPELVFINCCHLGNTDVRYVEAKRYNQLAANLGTQFINMGVKAVIAAGWAVDDAAAKAFAEAFYQAMLSGATFGKAVLVARRHIYDQYPNVNTWGAYQCYGDPDFRLFQNGKDIKQESYRPYHARVEWATDLENILSALRSKPNTKKEDEDRNQWLESCEKRVPDDLLEQWRAQADIASLLGTLYGELEQYESAIAYLDKAMSANKADFPVKALEQRANYRVKHALRFRNSKHKDEKEPAIREIVTAIEELNFFNRIDSTVERQCLLGSAYKRLAWLQSGKAERKKSLEQMREHYRFAFKNTPENESINAYPLTNWGAAEAILSWSDPGADKTLLGELRRYVGHAVAEANRKWKESPEFWDGVVEPDCLLMMALFKDEIAEKDIQMIAEGYRSAAERGASNKDITALREHIEFLIAMAEQFKKTDHRKSLLEILRQLP